ncbi:hypothetical protein Bbelb_385780 [Branchiostoma belcheri]|nr:hypothetical protein Bbelb_385780 [Branchiostoma belcheri]
MVEDSPAVILLGWCDVLCKKQEETVKTLLVPGRGSNPQPPGPQSDTLTARPKRSRPIGLGEDRGVPAAGMGLFPAVLSQSLPPPDNLSSSRGPSFCHCRLVCTPLPGLLAPVAISRLLPTCPHPHLNPPRFKSPRFDALSQTFLKAATRGNFAGAPPHAVRESAADVVSPRVTSWEDEYSYLSPTSHMTTRSVVKNPRDRVHNHHDNLAPSWTPGHL